MKLVFIQIKGSPGEPTGLKLSARVGREIRYEVAFRVRRPVGHCTLDQIKAQLIEAIPR